eukprot:7144496-Prymnesium_polylepis.1
MRFLSLTERIIGVPRPLDAVSTHFYTLFTFTPQPIPNAHVLAASRPHPPRGNKMVRSHYYRFRARLSAFLTSSAERPRRPLWRLGAHRPTLTHRTRIGG